MGIWCQKVTTFANVLRNYVFIAWFKAFEETTDFPPKGRWGRWSRRPEHILHFLQWIILLGQNSWILRIHHHIFSSTSMSWQDTGLYPLTETVCEVCSICTMNLGTSIHMVWKISSIICTVTAGISLTYYLL